MFRRKVLLMHKAKMLLVAVLSAGGLIAGSVSVAQAGVTSGNASQCAGGASTRVCLFWDNNFVSPKTELANPATSIGAMSDQASSIANNRNYRAFFHEHTNFGGWSICLSRNTKDNDLPNDRNDEISSVNFASTYQYC